MNIRRFLAPTAREALSQARQAFGEGTLILSNRPTANGVEVVATAEETLSKLGPAGAVLAKNQASLNSEVPKDSPNQSVAQDTQDMAMSTLSFQSYVRERMLRRRQEELGKSPLGSKRSVGDDTTLTAKPRPLHADLLSAMPTRSATPAPASATPTAVAASAPSAPTPAQVPKEIMTELQNMRDLIEERFNTFSWLGRAQNDPIQSQLMLKLIRAGYSPSWRAPCWSACRVAWTRATRCAGSWTCWSATSSPMWAHPRW